MYRELLTAVLEERMTKESGANDILAPFIKQAAALRADELIKEAMYSVLKGMHPAEVSEYIKNILHYNSGNAVTGTVRDTANAASSSIIDLFKKLPAAERRALTKGLSKKNLTEQAVSNVLASDVKRMNALPMDAYYDLTSFVDRISKNKVLGEQYTALENQIAAIPR